MKRKMLDMSDCKDIVKSSYFCQHFEEMDFKGRVCIIKFDEVAKKWKISDNLSILDNQYIWLEFYPYDCNYCFTAMYDNKSNLIEWYIDITRTIKKDNDSYIEDLFIDFVLLPNGDFFILDEEELEDAYSRKIINDTEYKTVLGVKEELTNKLRNINMQELIAFTNKYKDKLVKNNKDEDNIEKIEKRLDIAVILFNFSILFIFLASSLLFNGTKDADMNMAEVIFTLVFIIICLSSSYMEYKVVNIIKTINPEKKGDPMKLSFGKDWYNSCDEAQRKIIGEVAYKTYIITNTIFISIFLVVVLVSRYIDVGIFSIILIAAINIINVAVFGILSIKTEYKNVK